MNALPGACLIGERVRYEGIPSALLEQNGIRLFSEKNVEAISL